MTLLSPDLIAILCGICLALLAALRRRPDPQPATSPPLPASRLEQRLIAALPAPVWVCDDAGRLLLANPAFTGAGTDPAAISTGERFQVSTPAGPVSFIPREITLGDLTAFIAFPAGEDEQSRARLDRTLQVLSQSFALVPLGVAVFDLNGQLVLFNPAITELLGLDPATLARRPSLDVFLDLLRDQRKLPETASLRERRNLAAALGDPQPLQSDWSLPGGQVLRVRTRPLAPGGRLVLFEDVSHQISQHQQLATEAAIARAITDRVPDGIAVFDLAGRLVTANPALQALWGAAFEDGNINTLTSHWRALCHPSPFWGDLRDMVAGGAEREAWSEPVRLLTGRAVTCTVSPLPDGATLVLFSESESGAEGTAPSARA